MKKNHSILSAAISLGVLASLLMGAVSQTVMTTGNQTITGTKTFENSGGVVVKVPFGVNSGLFLQGTTGSGKWGLIYGAGSYGWLDVDKAATPGIASEGMRLSSYGPVIIGNNSAANYGTATFSEHVRIFGGQVGLGTGTSTSARLHIAAGTTGAAPIKLTTGPSLTAPETGAVEFSGNKLYFTPNSTREQIMTAITATGALDFPSIAAATTAELTLTVTGAATGDTVALGPPATLETGLVATGFVSAADTVTVRLANVTAGAIDPASATWRATVTH